jgi:hypothetical protein
LAGGTTPSRSQSVPTVERVTHVARQQIEVKTAAGRPKDKLAVIELLAILDRQFGKK